MENLSGAANRAGIARLEAIQPTHPRQWVKINAPQPLAHRSTGLEFAPEKPLTRHSPTDPEFRITGGPDCIFGRPSGEEWGAQQRRTIYRMEAADVS
jgi:hypothetical protein